MTLERRDFASFFAALHDGHRPFAWQERLLDHVVDAGTWPRLVDAPTGAGKTAAIDVHVFALALAAATGRPLPPRRLSMVVARRVLVDDQYRHALAVRDALAEPDDEVLSEVARQLRRLRYPGDRPGLVESPLVVARLRGGEPPSRSWVDEPSAAMVLCATPDMWGSRLLFRGYGASRRSWPRAAGLLAFDSAVVVDEAHLSGQLLTTARRVAELATVIEGEALGPSPLQVVETSATPGAGSADSSVGVVDDDLGAEPVLSERLTRPKPVTLTPSADWARSTPRSRVPGELADAVVGVLGRLPAPAEDGEARTVGCFVNTVGRAVAVADELRARSLRVVMLCGQVRPVEVERLRITHPGLLSTAGNAEVDVLVSTQTLEVGVDLDLAGMVSELASGSALAQRAGRVNRRGRRDHGPVTVVIPEAALKDEARSGPYDAPDLRDALAWIERRTADPDGLAPWAIRRDRPETRSRRTLHQRPEWAQAEHWARTSDDLAAEPELDLWLSEDVERPDDLSLGLVVRRDLPADDAEACELITLLPPRGHETFPLPFVTGREALREYRTEHGEPRALVDRGGDVHVLTWSERDGEWRPGVRPGDIVVVDACTELFTVSASGPQVLVPAGENVRRHRADDVLEAVASPRDGQVVLRVDLPDPSLPEPDDESAGERRWRLARESLRRELGKAGADRRSVLAEWLDEHGVGEMARSATGLLLSETRAVDVLTQGEDDDPVRVLVIDGRRAGADEDVRQEWTPSTGRVLLADHQRDVGDRAEAIGQPLGLMVDLVRALHAAGVHHDDGKKDPRFQFRLRERSEGEPVAKGNTVSPATARRRARNSGLPPGWRHEQRSAADAWGAIPEDVDRDLVARLIGTTHGSGRPGFPHTAGELLGACAGDTASWLFDEGEWDELIDRTHRRYGLWGCAYLEAVLRAADGQISAEGR